jgi:hypothetical protein
LVGILESFLGSCQSSSCQTCSFQFLLYWYMNSVICGICNSVKMSFLLWSQWVYPAVLLKKRISAHIKLLSSVLLIVHASLPQDSTGLVSYKCQFFVWKLVMVWKFSL